MNEKFSRDNPEIIKKFYFLRFFNFIFPILIVIIGIIISTQLFAKYMNYDSFIIGDVFFTINNYRFYNPGIYLLSIVKYSFNQSYTGYFTKSFQPLLISFGIAFFIHFITSLILNSHQVNQHTYGTAEWMKTKFLALVGHMQKFGVVCGETDKADIYSKLNPDPEKANIVLHIKVSFLFHKPKISPLICHSGSLNTWMIAPTGSGKGVSAIITTCLNFGVPYWVKQSTYEWIKNIKNHNILQNLLTLLSYELIIKGRRSIVIFDPKGENFAASAGFRSQFSIIFAFRPVDENHEGTAHYNPILEIPDNPETAFAWADTIAEIFFGTEKGKGGGDGTNEYFQNKARDIFTAVVLHVRFAPENVIPWKEKNMSKVLSFMSEASHDGELNENSDDEESQGCGEKMLSEMISTDHGSEEINNLIKLAANRSKSQPVKERGSTYSTVFSKITLFQDPLIAEATSFSDFSIDDFIKADIGISLYLIVPYNHIARIAPVFRMLITFMIKKFSSGTTNANSVKLKIPCMFLLDEFPVLGYFPDIALNMGILRGYGVTFFIVSQSMQQMADVYGENHPFLGHCKTKILYAPNEPKDAKAISEILGVRSVLIDNKSSSISNMSSVNLSSQEISVSLMNPDELMKLEYSRCIILIEGNAPYKGKKVVYYEDPRFKNKAFMPIPNNQFLKKTWKLLPSYKVKKNNASPLEIVNNIHIVNEINADFDIFSKENKNE